MRRNYYMTIFLATYFLLVSCYSPTSFQSDSASIVYMGYWSTPRYRIIFDEILVESGVNEWKFEFANAPPDLVLWPALSFESRSDVSTLVQSRARAVVTISDANGETIFAYEGSLNDRHTHDQEWYNAFERAFHAPSDWNEQPKGEVIKRSDFAKSTSEDLEKWNIARSGIVLRPHGGVSLTDGSYKVVIRFVVEDKLTAPIRILPMIEGGGRSVL